MTTNRPPVFRFAPSPNGLLHLGHAYSALVNFEASKALGGRFLLRIEDTDTSRSRPQFEQAIFDDLTWLGIKWEEPVRRQSEHFPDYRTALDVLETEGLTYRSYLTRSDIARIVESFEEDGAQWPRDPDGAPHFPGRAYEEQASIDDGSYNVRLDVQACLDHVGASLFWEEAAGADFQSPDLIDADPAAWSDIILARRDAPVSYNLAVVVDDALQGITHVVRGGDVREATAIHCLLQDLLGLPKPVYHHHRLILDESGRKLSKSKQDTSLASLRAAGLQPQDIRRMVGLDEG